MDYSKYVVYEAAQEQIAHSLVLAIKQMDIELAQKRLACIVKSNTTDADFLSIAAQFTSLVGHKTSIDT